MRDYPSLDILFALFELLNLLILLAETKTPCHGGVTAEELGGKSKATGLILIVINRGCSIGVGATRARIIVDVANVVAVFTSGVLIVVATIVGPASFERQTRAGEIPRCLIPSQRNRSASGLGPLRMIAILANASGTFDLDFSARPAAVSGVLTNCAGSWHRGCLPALESDR